MFWRKLAILLGTSLIGRAESVPPEIVALVSAGRNHHATFRVQRLSPEVVARVLGASWHQGCPVPLESLKLLTVTYWNFDGVPESGSLLVNAAVAKQVRGIFKKLYRHGFLIERMSLVDEYGGNDDRSMAANNTSSFNCRDITGHPGKFSNHSWGRAIDINPLTNPYVKQTKVLPPQGRQYLDRGRAYKGGILADSYIVRLFLRKGWKWGGTWSDHQDYQHFEKPERP